MGDKTKAKAKAKLKQRLRLREDAAAAAESAALKALHAEVVLLREENARLKAAEHELPGLSSLLRQVGALPGMELTEEVTDDAAHLLTETLVLRESLLEACRDIRRSLEAVEDRLRDPRAVAP